LSPSRDLAVAPDLAGVINADVGLGACLEIAACGIGMNGVSQCTAGVSAVENPYFAEKLHINSLMVTCIAAAKSCDDVRKCFNGGVTPQSCPAPSVSCDGSNLTACTAAGGTGGQLGTTRFDCASIGLTCVAGRGATDCGLGACTGLSAACVGNVLQACDAMGILRRFDCGWFGARCMATPTAGCRGTGAACSGTDALRCDGTVLVSCTGGAEARFDCGSIHLGCFAGVNGKPFGCALAGDCDAQQQTPTCTGSTLAVCDAGKYVNVDCTAGGYSSCDPSGIAHCVH
jgi:hypothetical protein